MTSEDNSELLPPTFDPLCGLFNKSVINDWSREKVVDFASFQNSMFHRGNIRVCGKQNCSFPSRPASKIKSVYCKNVSLFRAAFDFHVANLDDRIEMVIPSSGWQ